MGAGGRFGTVRAQTHLRYMLLHNDVKVLNKPEVMVPRAREFFDDDAQSDQRRACASEVADLVVALRRVDVANYAKLVLRHRHRFGIPCSHWYNDGCDVALCLCISQCVEQQNVSRLD